MNCSDVLLSCSGTPVRSAASIEDHSSDTEELKHKAQTRTGPHRKPAPCFSPIHCFCHTSLLYHKLKTLWRLSEIQQISVYLAAACVRVFSNSRLCKAKQLVFVHPWEGPKPEQRMKNSIYSVSHRLSILLEHPNRQM